MSPRPRQATGRPGTPVIPKNWEAAHAVVVAGTMRGRVALSDPTDTTQAWSDDTDQMVTIPAGPYASDVPARVQRLAGQAREVVAAEDDEVVIDHLVVVGWGMAEVRAGHIVTVTAATDIGLVGQRLRVHSVVHGTERFERDLHCTLT